MKAALFLVAFFLPSLGTFARPSRAQAEQALERLIAGNARFVAGELQHDHLDAARRAEIAQSQYPTAVIVGCADSRVPPELVFDQGLGDLFVVRVAGNVVEDSAIASVEYAVEHLGAKLVIVLGHERCGAVDAVLRGGKLPGHLDSLSRAIGPVTSGARKQGGDVLDNAVRANVMRVVRELEQSEPILTRAVHVEELSIVGARYDLDTGAVEILPKQL